MASRTVAWALFLRRNRMFEPRFVVRAVSNAGVTRIGEIPVFSLLRALWEVEK